ncbi:daf-6 (predicted) [Pycnogonum litorale]
MKLDCVDRFLTKLFYKLGLVIARHPYYFLLVPFFISAFLATGFQRLIYENDAEFLFTPIDGTAKSERAAIERHFPLNYSSFNAGRNTRKGRYGRVLVTSVGNPSVLRPEFFRDLLEIDRIVKNIRVTLDDETKDFDDDMCAKWNGRCVDNDVLELANVDWQTASVQFPVWSNPDAANKPYFLPVLFGGMKVSKEQNYLVDAKAVSLFWFLEAETRKQNRFGALWEKQFLKEMKNLNLTEAKVARFVSDTIEAELEGNSLAVIPLLGFSSILVVVFTFLALSMSDAVRSKPFLGCLGVLSAMLGTAAAFGLLCYVGLEFIIINMAAPFLMLGIGMDDTYVMLSAWRKTKLQDPVEVRMATMFSEAAVSITITSITDMLSFIIGIATPFPCVRIFCIYTALAVSFTFVYHITFFAACMAISGRLEAKNRHGALPFIKATPVSLSEHRNPCYRFFCTGGLNPNDPNNEKDNADHSMMVFFRDILATLLSLPPIKILVLCVFAAYLAIAMWSFTKLDEGLLFRRLSADNSYSITFYDTEDLYFKDYPYRVQLMIDEPLSYHDPKVQQDIEDILNMFESSTYVADRNMTESWLRSYKNYLENVYYMPNYTAPDETEFILQLRRVFLPIPEGSVFADDLKFAEDYTRIERSRFILQTKDIWNPYIESKMLSKLRDIASEAKFKVKLFNPHFIFMDQYLYVRIVTIQAVTVAVVVMMIVTLIFIPNPLCALWVGFSILSIEVGVIGYMALWKVNLDCISMIHLIMCIGFSVDFSAHVSYAYMSSKEEDPNDRMKDALYSLGVPIVQGAVSTVAAVFVLLMAGSYIYITFFKVVFLVMLFGALHGLFLLPVLLSLTRPGSYSRKKSKTTPFVIAIHDKSEGFKNGDVSTLTIPRPKTTTLDKSNDRRQSGEKIKDKLSDSDRDLGLGTSAEDSSDASVPHVYDNNGYSSEEDDVIGKHRRSYSNPSRQQRLHSGEKPSNVRNAWRQSHNNSSDVNKNYRF